MTVYEMECFLRGKCLPGDMKVNETNAQYLVRKFSELQSKNADMAVQLANAESKCRELAAENAALKSFGDKLYSMYKGLETSGGGFHDEQSIPYQQAALDAAISAFEEIKTPATDAILAEVRAQGVEGFLKFCGEENSVFVEAKAYYRSLSDAVDEFAAQLRKGAAL